MVVTILRNRVAVSTKAEYLRIMLIGHLLCMRAEEMCRYSRKDLSKCYSNSICNSPKLDIFQKSINSKMDK